MDFEQIFDPMFTRSLPLFGETGLRRLAAARVAVFGLGGVGSYTVEALARAGVGTFLLVDGDVIETTNLNRQLYALRSSVGKNKTELARDRILDINPNARISIHSAFVNDDEIEEVLAQLPNPDLILDAIDSIRTKVALITKAVRQDIPIFSSMGAGYKLDPTRVRCTDLTKTYNDPLARIMRRELRAEGIVNLPVVFSDEIAAESAREKSSFTTPASSPLVPPAFGLALASLAIRYLIGKESYE
ncbi:MAG TPA: tRNA threonylcarbamoyladenosine dehydratase [Clostridiaceae bacterium]|nr:tRNA threonylcarbamoyladenosine dehydratase [Clostridiaceae bacterium]